MISDAGTPSISDPGRILVKECIVQNINVIPLPGPSSVLSAVSASGFSDKFFFYGFLPEKKKILEQDLKYLSLLNSSIVFFISPKKIKKILESLRFFFAGRKIVICREMTKYYEEFIRCDIDDLNKVEFKLKGEFTIVISEKSLNNKTSQTLSESDKKIINQMINKISIKEIISIINKDNRLSKKEIYNYCIKLKNES
jgi:16S rRNA (cytidine1402-2'-O)-methyltransferase